MKTTVPYSRDTNKYYVFEQDFQPGLTMRVSVYVLKSECPQPPIYGSSSIDVTIEPTPVTINDFPADGPGPEPVTDRQFEENNEPW